jgi:hypothetical protein
MNNKRDNNNPKDKHQLTMKEDIYQYSETGVYLRDDHCDWGSSGMNEYTNEHPLHIISDDK